MKIIIVAFLLAFFEMSVSAQDLKLRHIKSDVDKFPLIISTLQVSDNSGEPKTNLKNKNFAISIDGQTADSVRAVTYKESGAGFNIMLCLDASGSMAGTPLQTMKNSIIRFIDDMRDIDKLAITTFANGAKLVADFSNNKEFLKGKIKELTTSGNQTSFYYGANYGFKKLLDYKDDAGKIMMIIGDGRNENKSSSFSEDDLIEDAIKEGVPIFTLGYTKIDRAYLQSLERISEKTGGSFYDSPTDQDLDRQYKKIYRQILNIYVINYIASGIRGDGAEHIEAITVNTDGIRKSASSKFIAPAGIAPVIVDPVHNNKSSIKYYLMAGIIIIIAAGGGIIFNIYRKRKGKRLEEERIALEKENRRRNSEADKTKFGAEKTIQKENEYNEKSLPQNRKIKPQDRDRTMILGSEPSALVFSSIRLEIMTGECQGRLFDIDINGATIGRADENSIVIKEATMSKTHAKIVFENGCFFVEDLGSSNGTFINERKIDKERLNHNDIFKFGKCEGTVIFL